MNINTEILNKTIYMTYKKQVPTHVFERWKALNTDYEIDFSLDDDCINFLKDNFNDYIVELFRTLPRGMYKADLWRLCKLYINGGVYADVDLIPHLNIDSLDKNISFYSCMSLDNISIFQAFMINFSKPKNPLILNFLISFLHNNPCSYQNGPTYDMYNVLKHNLNDINIVTDKKYEIEEVKIKINIGSSEENVKLIDFHFFPKEITDYTIKLTENHYSDAFDFIIFNNKLIVQRMDKNHGWAHNHSADICIKSNESFYLFKETCGPNYNWVTSYVTFNGNKILDSRDMDYYNNKGW